MPKSVHLAYGRAGLDIEVPDSADVLEPYVAAPVSDEPAAIRDALAKPIASASLLNLVRPGSRVAISVCDVTRPFPSLRVLPVLLDFIEPLHPAEVTVFIATGTHRACSAVELHEMLGGEVLNRVRVVQNDAFDSQSHTDVGLVPGSALPARINTEFTEHDVRMTLGFIEPHFFAGFSGGPKMIAPGLAQLETVLELHSATRISDPRATWGVTMGNPIHDAVRSIADRVGVTFNLDVTLDRNHRITALFGGNLARSHAAGCEFARRTAMVEVRAAYDVVVTTNSGYPLDQNLYQAVKGMSAAAQIVRKGGTILLASACADGLPAHGNYGQLLRTFAGPSEFLAELDRKPTAHDQWQVQIQARIQQKARVLVHASGLTSSQLAEAWLEPVDDISAWIREHVRPDARVAVLPLGPQTIPYLAA